MNRKIIVALEAILASTPKVKAHLLKMDNLILEVDMEGDALLKLIDSPNIKNIQMKLLEIRHELDIIAATNLK